jgi:hypothetical protein
METYPRFISKDSEPFDPMQLAAATEALVIKEDAGKYTAFYLNFINRAVLLFDPPVPERGEDLRF